MMQMRKLITVIVTAGFLTAACAAYSQNNSAPSSKQLVRVWEQTNQKSVKEGMIEGNVVLVFDGDTIGIVAKDGARYTIRLRGIDAPENRQPFGRESADQLSYLIQGMNVVAFVGDKDVNNRHVGSVFLDGEDISLSQLRKGMAWSYVKNGVNMSNEQKDAFSLAEQKARAEHVGLWSSPDPIAPWVFRGENDGGSPNTGSPSKGPVTKPTTPTEVKPKIPASAENPKAATSTATRKYIVGPRGGCYYLNENGAKTYVRNKELCNKQ